MSNSKKWEPVGDALTRREPLKNSRDRTFNVLKFVHIDIIWRDIRPIPTLDILMMDDIMDIPLILAVVSFDSDATLSD